MISYESPLRRRITHHHGAKKNIKQENVWGKGFIYVISFSSTRVSDDCGSEGSPGISTLVSKDKSDAISFKSDKDGSSSCPLGCFRY
jgi:hypothetical protein